MLCVFCLVYLLSCLIVVYLIIIIIIIITTIKIKITIIEKKIHQSPPQHRSLTLQYIHIFTYQIFGRGPSSGSRVLRQIIIIIIIIIIVIIMMMIIIIIEKKIHQPPPQHRSLTLQYIYFFIYQIFGRGPSSGSMGQMRMKHTIYT